MRGRETDTQRGGVELTSVRLGFIQGLGDLSEPIGGRLYCAQNLQLGLTWDMIPPEMSGRWAHLFAIVGLLALLFGTADLFPVCDDCHDHCDVTHESTAPHHCQIHCGCNLVGLTPEVIHEPIESTTSLVVVLPDTQCPPAAPSPIFIPPKA